MNTQILMVLDVLAKSLGVLLFAAALQLVWRKSSASQRCLVWLAAFSVLLLLPLTAIMKPVWTVKVPDQAPPPAVLHELPMIQSVPVIPEDDMALPPVAEPAWHMPQLDLWQWLGLAWFTGVCILLLRRAAGAWQLRRLYKESFACETPRIFALASRLASELGVHRRVDLRLSSKVTVPLTWGFIKPVLLLPADAAEWQEASLHAALCHELGHIRHWDALSRLLMSVLCALQWPNALLWLAAKSWRTAQEQACDDLVLNSGASKEAYAMQLLESARSVQRLGFLHAALTMAQPSTLETRLSAIMDPTRDRRALRRGALLVGLASAVSLLMLCAALQLRAESPSRVTLDAGNLHLTCDEFHFNDLARQTGIATGHVIVNVTRDDGTPSTIHEGKADEVEFDLSKREAILRGHPEILMGTTHRHYGTGDETEMVIHWDGSHIRTDTHGPAKTELLPGAHVQVKPLKNAAGAESPFKNVEITGEQTNFDPATGIATAKGHVEVMVTSNGTPPVISRVKGDAAEYDSNKHEVILHGHVEIPDSATEGVRSFDDKDVIMKWDAPSGSWQVRAVKTANAGGQGPDKPAAAVAYFTVFGQVQRQGKYELAANENLTLTQALLRAGGPTAAAKTKKVHVVRRTGEGKSVTINVNADDVMKNGNVDKDIFIRPNDVIIVDERIMAGLGPHDAAKFAEAKPEPGPIRAYVPPPDPNAAIERITDMEKLDDTTLLRVGDLVSFRIVEDHDRVMSLRVQNSGDLQTPHLGLVKAAGRTCKKVAYEIKQHLEKNLFEKATVIIAIEYRGEPKADQAGSSVTAHVGASKAAGPLVFDHVAAPPHAPSASPGEEAGDRYFQGYLRESEGRRLEDAGDVAGARKKYQEAQQIFDAAAHDDLTQKPEAMPHRQKQIEDSLQRMDSKAVVPAPSIPPPPASIKVGAAAVPAKGSFTVFGQVKRQGKYELEPGEKLTLSQALQRAGGPTVFAKTRKIHVVRKTSEGGKTINVNYDNVVKGGKTEEDILIEHDDVIMVDDKGIDF